MATFIPDTTNEIFQLAIQLVNQTNLSIFLTGKAGTGKTTFLKHIRTNCPKQMAIVAPTGVAAINAGGVTLHSFFQLPLSPFIPDSRGTGFAPGGIEISDKHSLINRLRYNGEKRKILQQLELLVVDEISMVRCDLLDAVDTVLKHVRQRPQEPFGGVQLLFIGDLFQLPPVVREEEWNLLSGHYSGHYFFDSHVLRDTPPLCIEFNKIYRQKDEQFIQLLNQVRNNQLDHTGSSLLENRYNPTFRRTKNDGYIVLTTHNNKASEINNRELAELSTPVFRYDAEVDGDFSERSYPAEEILYLKEGAQVMFIRNDPAENGKRFYNGKIGTITRLETNKIFVTCQDETGEIEVQREKWENIRYTVNNSTRKLESEVMGSFIQHPLRLAWAITIHKSQGLTFEKAIIDAGEAFSPGQVYVALSRCTSLDGIVLQSRVRQDSISNDPRIIQFARKNASDIALKQALETGSKTYHENLLLSLFRFDREISSAKAIQSFLAEHKSSFGRSADEWINELLSGINRLRDVGSKFNAQLKNLFQQYTAGLQVPLFQDRIIAAAGYFIPETGLVIEQVRQCPLSTDSRLHAKEFNELTREIFGIIAEKQFLITSLKEGYNALDFMEQRSKFVLPSFAVNIYAGASGRQSGKQEDSPNPELYTRLRKLRDNICAKTNQAIYLVAGSNTLGELAHYLPQSKEELQQITGFGDVKIEKFGQQFLDIICVYCQERGLQSLIHEKAQKTRSPRKTSAKSTKGETCKETLRLYQEGKSLSQIALERKLATGTIESHFAKLAASGEIDPKALIGPDKFALIESALTNTNGENTLTAIKTRLGDSISFGDIRIVIASLKQKEQSEE